jgi:transcriptional regulator with XRE-family HTH domain
MTLGERLKMIRQKNKLKLKEAGALFDMTAQTLSRYENNERTPDNDFLREFGKHFRLSGDWLLYGEPPIYRGADMDRDEKESFLELAHLINDRGIPGTEIPVKFDFTMQKLSEDIPENYLFLLRCMMKNPVIRKGIFQFFYLFLKPLFDTHPELSEQA